jgi:hypothetical protein
LTTIRSHDQFNTTIGSVADESNQPASKSIRVKVRASENPDQVGRNLKAEVSVDPQIQPGVSRRNKMSDREA